MSQNDWILRNVPKVWTAKVCESVSEYDGADELAVSCTQLGDDKLQRRLIKEWCAFLPQASAVRKLAFYTHTNQKLFDAACNVPSLEWLYIKWGNIRNLSALANLGTLQYLDFSSCPSAVPASIVGSLTNLRYLRFNNVRDAMDIGWVSQLLELRELSISGSMWTSQLVRTLEPVSTLANLRLFMAPDRVLDRPSLRSLASLKQLRELHLPHTWPRKADVEYLLSENPNLTIMDWPWD